MTDFHAMTDTALNEWIAQHRNGEALTLNGNVYHKIDSVSNSMFIRPDYCNDWKWAGELEAEGKFMLMYNEIHNLYHAIKTEGCLAMGWSDRPTRAIAEAYAVMVENKKDGDG